MDRKNQQTKSGDRIRAEDNSGEIFTVEVTDTDEERVYGKVVEGSATGRGKWFYHDQVLEVI